MRCLIALSLLLLLSGRLCRADDLEVPDSLGTALRLIPAGRFEMGAGDLAPGFSKDHAEFSAGDESPVHPVVLTKPCSLAATEVTRGQFRRFVDEAKYVTTAERNRLGIVGWDPTPPAENPRFVATFRQDPKFTWKSPGFEQDDTHPVVGVSFEDAKAYCAWLSRREGATYRLPTEAEWEYAARAGTSTWFPFGNGYRGTIHRFANIGNVELEKAFSDRVRRQWLVDVDRDPADKHVFTAPVGSYEANPWKLHDMAGNVWEWCEDRYLDTYYTQFDRPGYQQVRKRAIDPLNAEKAGDHGDWRVIRGGSWFNAPIQCRPSHRSYFEATDAACYLGFRVVREAPPAAVADARQKFERSEAARQAIERLTGGYRENRDGRLFLRLRRDQITPELVGHLQQLDEPIDVNVDGQQQLAGDEVAGLAKAPQLRGLLLGNAGSKIADTDFAVLASHPGLEELTINETRSITDGAIVHLAGLTQLESLRLHGEGITDAGLARLPALTKLRTLSLSQTQATGAVLARLDGSPLESLAFENFRDEQAPRLQRFKILRDVTLSGSPITGPTLDELSRLPRLINLYLDRCTKLKDEHFRLLARCSLVQRLNVEGTEAGDIAAETFAGFNILSDLRLGSARLTDAGLQKLCDAVSLRTLALSRDATEVTDAGLRDLWRLRNLYHLELHTPRLAGSGLSTLHELPELRTLVLTSPALTDTALREVARSDSVEQLTIGNWQGSGPAALTDAGLQHLSQMRSLKQLNLFRKDTGITEAGVERLRTQKPGLTVTVR